MALDLNAISVDDSTLAAPTISVSDLCSKILATLVFNFGKPIEG